MRKSKVWNKGTAEYREMFKGKEIVIPSGQFVLMGSYDAAEFKGKYPGKGVKKIVEVEDLPGEDKADMKICNMCGESFGNDSLLFQHLKTHRKKDDAPSAENENEIAELRAKLAELEALIRNKKPGPKPKKEAKHDTGTDTGVN